MSEQIGLILVGRSAILALEGLQTKVHVHVTHICFFSGKPFPTLIALVLPLVVG